MATNRRGVGWHSTVAIAAAVLVAALFGLVLHTFLIPGGGGATSRITPATTARATATATPKAHILAWRQVSLPPGADPRNGDGIAVSPLDGRVAWACAPSGTGSFTIWDTRDAGATWTQAGTLAPAATSDTITFCTLVPDELDLNTLVLDFSWGSGEAGTLRSMSYISTDGGARWQRIPGDIGVAEVGTIGGTTYAVLNDTDANPNLPPLGLVASVDGLMTWRALRPPDLATTDSIFRFWITPPGNQVFAASLNDTLWTTDGAGANWSRINARNMQTNLGLWLAPSGQWLFCNWADAQTLRLACSADLGKTWTPRPTFETVQQCGACGKGGAPYTSTQSCYPNAILADGTLLAVCPTTGANLTPNQPQFSAFSLSADAQAWTNLGPAHGSFFAAATGQLWCLDSQTGALYVATLPA